MVPPAGNNLKQSAESAPDGCASHKPIAGVLAILVALIIGAFFFRSAPTVVCLPLQNDANSSYYLNFARNIVRYPAVETMLLNRARVGASAEKLCSGYPTPSSFYPDHPLGITWAAALLMKVIPEPIVAGRAVSIIASAITAAAIFYFSVIQLGWLAGFAALACIFAMPIFWIHGLVLNFEPMTCCLIVLASISFAYCIATEHRGLFWLSILLWTLGMLTDWPAYFVGATAGLHYLLKRQYGKFVFIAGWGVGCFAATFLYYAYAMDNWVFPLEFFKSAMRPIYNPDAVKSWLTWPEILSQVGIFLRGNFTTELLVLLPCSVFFALKRPTRPAAIFLQITLLVATFNIFIFKQWAGTHNFWSYYYLPCIAMAAGAICSGPVIKRGVGLVFVFFLLWGARDRSRETFQSLHSFATCPFEKSAEELMQAAKSGAQFISAGELPYYYQGYTARLYLDVPLVYMGSVIAQRNSCNSDRDFLVLNYGGKHLLSPELQAIVENVPLFQWDVIRLKRAVEVTGKGCAETTAAVFTATKDWPLPSS